MRSTGDRRQAETNALSEHNVKQRKAKHLPTTGKRVYATVDGRGTVGRNAAAKIKVPFSDRVIATPYMTGFGDWVSNRPEKAKPKHIKRAPKYSSLAGAAGGPGSNDKPDTSVDHHVGLMHTLQQLNNFNQGAADSVSSLNPVLDPINRYNKWVLGRVGLGADEESDAYRNGGIAADLGTMFVGGGAGLGKGLGKSVVGGVMEGAAKRFAKDTAKAAAKKSPREMKRGVEIAVRKSKGSRKASSFKKWSESQKPPTPKKPAPKPKPISDEVVQFETAAVDPRQPRPLSMALLRPTEPDYLQGWHLMNINAPTWYTPFRVWRNPSELA